MSAIDPTTATASELIQRWEEEKRIKAMKDEEEKNLGVPSDELRPASLLKAAPCPHCGALPVEGIIEGHEKPDVMLVHHKWDCYRREPGFEILFKENLGLWNTRHSPLVEEKQ